MANSSRRTPPAKSRVQEPSTEHLLSEEPVVDSKTIDRMLAASQSATAVQRAAFLRQWSDADCDAAGAGTKAPDTLREATRAVIGVDVVLAEHAAAVRYGLPRFRFLLEAVRDVRDLVEAQQRGPDPRSELEQAKAAGLAARQELYDVLEPIVGKAGKEALTTAYGRADTPQTLGLALGALAAIASDWLSRKDADSKALVQSHYLGQADVDEAERAAARLDRAQEALTRGASPARDTPAINRAEGRMLLELDLLRRALERGHEKNRLIPQLVLGPVLRRLWRLGKAAAAAATDGAPTDGAPANPPKPA
jgi:hypothetical protein